MSITWMFINRLIPMYLANQLQLLNLQNHLQTVFTVHLVHRIFALHTHWRFKAAYKSVNKKRTWEIIIRFDNGNYISLSAAFYIRKQNCRHHCLSFSSTAIASHEQRRLWNLFMLRFRILLLIKRSNCIIFTFAKSLWDISWIKIRFAARLTSARERRKRREMMGKMHEMIYC